MSSHAEKCPVCGGSGKYTPPNDGRVTAVPSESTCHGCGGKGWIVVGYEEKKCSLEPNYEGGTYTYKMPDNTTITQWI